MNSSAKKPIWQFISIGPESGLPLVLWYTALIGLMAGQVFGNIEKRIAWSILGVSILWLMADYLLRRNGKHVRLKLGFVALAVLFMSVAASLSTVDVRIQRNKSFQVRSLPVVYKGTRKQEYNRRVSRGEIEGVHFIVASNGHYRGSPPLRTCVLIEIGW